MTVLEIHLDEAAAALTPELLAGNPLIQQDPIYALPPDTITALSYHLVIDTVAAQHEMALAEYCTASGTVGLWQDKPIPYPLLRDPKQEFSSLARIVGDYLKHKGDYGRRNYVIGELQARWLPQVEMYRAYAGWIVTNPRFRAELAVVAKRWRMRIAHHGLPRVGSSGRGILFHPGEPIQRQDESTFIAEYAVLCRRWRLAGLASLDLPIPVPNHLTVEPPSLTRWHTRMGGGGIHVADIYAVPSRDQFQQIIGDLQAHTRSDHLEEWSDIVHRRAPGGVGLMRYGHALAVNHFWNVVRSRYAVEIRDNTTAVDEAIGQGLGQSAETVRQTRLLIQQRLAA